MPHTGGRAHVSLLCPRAWPCGCLPSELPRTSPLFSPSTDLKDPHLWCPGAGDFFRATQRADETIGIRVWDSGQGCVPNIPCPLFWHHDPLSYRHVLCVPATSRRLPSGAHNLAHGMGGSTPLPRGGWSSTANVSALQSRVCCRDIWVCRCTEGPRLPWS